MKNLKSLDDFMTELVIEQIINEMADNKDIKRIEDIVIKSKGNKEKQIQLAQTMANRITKKDKALGRYQAAVEVLGPEDEVTQIFAAKASDLGNDITKIEKRKTETLGKLGSKMPGTKATTNGKRRYYGGRPYPILPLGRTNLKTGKCQHFNIYETWGEGDDTTIELWQADDWGEEGNYKVVFTSGSSSYEKIGNYGSFVHDQTGRPLFDAKMIDWCQIGDAKLLMREYNLKSPAGYVYK